MNASANATETFQRSSLAHGGLVLFCPDDNAVAAFKPSFDDLGADDQLAVLLYHGVAPASLRDRSPTKAVTVPTLATDLADGGYGLTIRHRGDRSGAWPGSSGELWSSSGGMARVIRMVTGQEEPLVVYLIDAVLLRKKSINCSDSSCPHGTDVVVVRGLSGIGIFLVAGVVFIAVILLGVVIYSKC